MLQLKQAQKLTNKTKYNKEKFVSILSQTPMVNGSLFKPDFCCAGMESYFALLNVFLVAWEMEYSAVNSAYPTKVTY